MKRALLAAAAATLLAMPHANAAPKPFVVSDPAGDATFSGLHGKSLPAGSQAAFDIVSVTFDTTKVTKTKVVNRKKVTTVTPTGLKITLRMNGPASTAPGSSYGLNGVHSACGSLRLQVYYTPQSGATPYGDLSACGTNTAPTATNPEQFKIEFTPKVSGNTVVFEIPFTKLPRAVKAGTFLDGLTAYTSLAEPVKGYQPTDFEQAKNAGIDIATAASSWKIG